MAKAPDGRRFIAGSRRVWMLMGIDIAVILLVNLALVGRFPSENHGISTAGLVVDFAVCAVSVIACRILMRVYLQVWRYANTTAYLRLCAADVLVFATPVYYYSVSGQLKTMLDRANPLYGSNYAFTKAYLLAAVADEGANTVEGAVKAIQGWVDCFERCELAGTIFAGGVNGVGDIAGHPALEEAYQTGRDI